MKRQQSHEASTTKRQRTEPPPPPPQQQPQLLTWQYLQQFKYYDCYDSFNAMAKIVQNRKFIGYNPRTQQLSFVLPKVDGNRRYRKLSKNAGGGNRYLFRLRSPIADETDGEETSDDDESSVDSFFLGSGSPVSESDYESDVSTHGGRTRKKKRNIKTKNNGTSRFKRRRRSFRFRAFR